MLFDAHIHNKNHEDGGFLIGLEGAPYFEGTLNNKEVMALHDPSSNYFSFYYVTSNEINDRLQSRLLKYHPRREHYSPDEVSNSIRKNQPSAVIIDTLNEPFWNSYDYWKVARNNPNIPMIMAHAGGYLINDFIKICHFQPNVWIDFALTHTTLGHLGDRNLGLPYIDEAINYSLHSSFNHRVLMSSDYPFYNQDDVFRYYRNFHDLLNENFIIFSNAIR